MKRLFGIATVWIGCSFAWVILGSTLLVRSDDSGISGQGDVHQLWGPPAEQGQPRAFFREPEPRAPGTVTYDPSGNPQPPTTTTREVAIELARTDVEVDLDLEHRRRGLSWYPTYTVSLDGRYTFRNDTDVAREIQLVFPLSARAAEQGWDSSRSYAAVGAPNATYDAFDVEDEEGRSVDFAIEGEHAAWTAEMAPGEARTFRVTYRSRGTETWRYRMAAGTSRVRNFRLAITTDFGEVDFPEDTLSPTEHGQRGDGWRGVWDFESLIANRPIGVEMPVRVNPGPLAARITFFAPVGLLFFFFVVGILAMDRKKDLHPMHYFFLGTSFFAFHLLFAYLVDHLEIGASFAISAGVSVLLVTTYARLFTGWRFALQHIGISQLLYLVLFSYTFMWEGFTGLAITIGAILTLFVMMQITGRTKWGQKKSALSPADTELPSAADAELDAAPKAF